MDNEGFVYVHVGEDRVRILDQDENMVLDFLADDRIANKLACKINIGTLRRPDGIYKDQHPV